MLKIRYKENKYNAVWLVEPMISIGRSATNDLVVDDAYVVEKHIEVHVSHEKLTLKNLQPSKPVKVNGKDVPLTCPLHEDDEITIGDIVLVVIDPKRESKIATVEAANSTQLRPLPAAATGTGWALKANHTALANRVFPLKDLTVVGRAAECDICLSTAHLSRRHAQLQVVDGALYVKDLGSANGTFLNGKQVMEARVKRGDELRFDALIFGVMGPADELAKTSVRATPPSSQGISSDAESPKGSSVKPAPVPATVVTTAKPSSNGAMKGTSAEKKEEPKNSSGKMGLIFFALLAVVVVVALVVKR
jgi:pSer/pThr/pTyr-binding forkhead associated (FHA) protein